MTTPKTFGQIAFEKSFDFAASAEVWTNQGEGNQAHWERIAQAVADAVIERQKDECEEELRKLTEWHHKIAAPQPTADERLERLLADVEMYGHAHAVETRNDAFRGHESMAGRPQYDLPAMYAEIEQSARALLSASQEDAEQQARLVELVLHMAEAKRLRDWEDLHIDLSEAISIAKAMKEKKA